MRITYLRINKKKLTNHQMEKVMSALQFQLGVAGFITEVQQKSSTSIKVGLHMRCFQLDLRIHDRNLQVSRAGDKLTNLPTWDQRVEFNNIINRVLDEMKVHAVIRSGPYIIRDGYESMTENDWHDQKPDWVRHNEYNGHYIESVDEKQYLEERRIRRNERAREKRRQQKMTVNGSNVQQETKQTFKLYLVK